VIEDREVVRMKASSWVSVLYVRFDQPLRIDAPQLSGLKGSKALPDINYQGPTWAEMRRWISVTPLSTAKLARADTSPLEKESWWYTPKTTPSHRLALDCWGLVKRLIHYEFYIH
jgi:hypothetical protein